MPPHHPREVRHCSRDTGHTHLVAQHLLQPPLLKASPTHARWPTQGLSGTCAPRGERGTSSPQPVPPN